MKKHLITAAAVALPLAMFAQSALDGYTLSQNELRGTARFVSMGGAFTALGGDLSTLGQNPAGVGVYRSSEVGVTLDISGRSFSTSTPGYSNKQTQTKAYCNNFGYVGATTLGGPLKSFGWGASYNRVVSFDRVYSGYNRPTNSSLSNYIAAFSEGVPAGDLNFGSDYDPYWDSSNDWLSILAYNAYMINPTVAGNTYNGLYQNGTEGDALYEVREKGYVDEYNIDFGGNVENVIYWGLGVGITDLSYTRDVYYSESMENAYVNVDDRMVTGDAGFDLRNHKYVTGTGWNFKVGVIAKPVNELRIGFAVHTPTYYNLSTGADATVDYSYYNPATDVVNSGYEYTDVTYYDWKLRTPWRMMAGVAGVIGTKAIVSLDYERQAYNDMSMKVQNYSGWGDMFIEDENLKSDIKNYFQAANIIRVGAEYRVTPQFSVRAGYNVAMTNVKSEAENGSLEMFTVGTDPSYSLDKTTHHISVGLGYRYRGFYVDAAYVHKNRKSTFHAYTNYSGVKAPAAEVSENVNSGVISVGFKF